MLSRTKILSVLFGAIALLPASAAAGTVTFDGGGDGTSWNDADNWDADLVPGLGDDVVIPDGFDVSGSQPNAVESVTVEGYSSLGDFVETFSAGTFTFNGNSSAYGLLSGSFVFNDASNNSADMLSGDVIYNDTSYHNGSVNGDVTLNTTFYGASAPSGGVFVIDTSHWAGGTISGTVYGSDLEPVTVFRFEGSTANNGTVSVDAIFDSSYYPGAATGVITFSGTSYHSGSVLGTLYGPGSVPITELVFEDTSFNNGTIRVDATFNDSSYNEQSVLSGATFSGLSYNSGEVYGDIVFAGSSKNQLVASGTVAFLENSENDYGYVYGDASFAGSSHNRGNIFGDVTFGGDSYSADDPIYPDDTGTITGTASFLENSQLRSGEVVGTMLLVGSRAFSSAYLDGDVDLVSFSDSSYNDGVVPGNAVFNDSSYNAGTVSGDADVYSPSPKPIGGTVLGSVTYHGYPSDPEEEEPEESSSSRRPSGGRSRRSLRPEVSVMSGSGAGSSGLAASQIPTRDLEEGSVGEDVLALQRFLNRVGFALADEGPGSSGAETDFFGVRTRAALARWQLENGVVPAAGYFGPITRAAMAGQF